MSLQLIHVQRGKSPSKLPERPFSFYFPLVALVLSPKFDSWINTLLSSSQEMATRTCTTIRVQRSAIQLSGPVKREVHEQDLASVISTYTTSSWMAVCYCQPAYCLQTGNGRLSACAKNNLLTRHLKVTGHSITQSLNNNCARGLIPWIYIWQWLKREKMSTISSFMFAASVFEGHVLGRTDSPILFDRRTTWAVPR